MPEPVRPAHGTVEPFVIRSATARDVAAIHALIRELAEFERLSADVVSNEISLHEALFGEQPAAEALVAASESETIGFALFFQNYSTFVGRRGIYLEDVYVKPGWRGCGAGKALLAELGRIARDRGAGRLEWSVLNWNENAIRFYEKLGAQVLPDWRVVRLDREGIRKLAEGGG